MGNQHNKSRLHDTLPTSAIDLAHGLAIQINSIQPMRPRKLFANQKLYLRWIYKLQAITK